MAALEQRTGLELNDERPSAVSTPTTSSPKTSPGPTLANRPIADALVLVLSPNTGINEWHQRGVLDREWALYERLSASFGRIVLVTDTGEPTPAVVRRLELEAGSVRVLANRDGLERSAWLNVLPGRLEQALAGCRRAVIKTNQFSGAEAALVALASAQRLGLTAGLVARGGYLWSRFEAELEGPESRIAAEVASREGELCRAAHVVVGTTPSMLEDLSWRYGLSVQHTKLIPNYVIDDGALVGPEDREPGTLLVCGQLVERKRVDLVLRAAAMISETTEVRVEVVGDGPLAGELKAMAGSLNVDATFTASLPHEALLERMRRCALFVQMSEREGHPKTVLEAMAAGAPVIVADAPGLSEQITHGVTGLVCPAEPMALAHMAGPLLEDAAWRASIGESAQLHIRRTSSMDAVVPKEIEAMRWAVSRALKGEVAGPTPPPVRWSPELLTVDAEHAVDAWQHSLHGYAKRLKPREAARFLAMLDGWVYSMQGEAAIKADPDGLHPKHRLTRYHDFFTTNLDGMQRVLDLGSGVGALACSIAERCGAEVVGQELSSRHVEVATERAGKVGLAGRCSFVRGDITCDRVEGNFDALVLSNVLEHLRDRPALLRQWCDWYRPSRVLIRVPSYDREWRVPWKDELGVDSRLDSTHEIEFTREALEAELDEAKLDVLELTQRWGELWLVSAPRAQSSKATRAA